MEEGDLRVNYEQELNNLRNAQKNAAVADLQATRDTSLSNLQAEEAKIKPTYAAQRSTANAQNRIAARNFQEYLANTGRANSGIGAQYEMSRQNSLQNGLNAINSAEAQSLADIARRRSDVQNAYNTGLASANANVEANYIKNLLDQRQQQWERDFAQKQFDESVRQYNQNRQDQLNRAFSSGGGSGSSRRSGGSGGSKNDVVWQDTSNETTPVVNGNGAVSTTHVGSGGNTFGGGGRSFGGPEATIASQNAAIKSAAKVGDNYPVQVITANGGIATQLWKKTANGKDYRVR